MPPNPDIASTFFLAGVIEAWGRGIEKIVALCLNAGMPEPLVSHDGTGLWLTFPFAARVGARVAGQVTAQVGVQVAAQVTAQVSPEILRLLAVMEGERTRAELQLALSLSSRRHFDARYLKPAVQLGLVALTLPDKPNSRLQKYRLTPEGLAALSAPPSRPPRKTP